MRDIMEVLHVPDIVNAYGQTECSPICSLTRVSDPMEKRLTTVGTRIENVENKIVDDDNNEVPNGTVGEICTRGWHVMKFYYKEPEKTAQTIDEDGWLHTGDLGILDDEGYLQIAGRKKDMINYGGFKIFPRIVEDYLLTNSKVHEVAVVGVPDPEYGEQVAAVAKVDEDFTEQDLVDFCYGKISDPSVPRYVKFDVSIPLSGRGKVQKYKLVETLKQMQEEGTLGEKLVPTVIQKKKASKK
jgi:fatty-acyl-CoA synthase